MKKKILLFGFNNKQIIFLKNKFKNKINFITQNKLKYNITLQIDAIIGITRRGFLDFLKKILIQKKIKPHWVHLPGAGVEEYTIFKNLDINFSNGKIIQGVQVSEHAIALLLSLTRNLVPILKKGTNVKFERRPIEIKGKKALIYGYGGIGRLLAEKLNSFGVEVSAVNRNYVPIDSNISKLYVNRGPGSFAGIRNSLAVVKAIYVARKIDYYCFSFSDFDKLNKKEYENIPNLCDKLRIKKNLIKPIYIS